LNRQRDALDFLAHRYANLIEVVILVVDLLLRNGAVKDDIGRVEYLYGKPKNQICSIYYEYSCMHFMRCRDATY
jgi:hypothetical protein